MVDANEHTKRAGCWDKALLYPCLWIKITISKKNQNNHPALDNVCKPIKLHSNLEVMFLGKKGA